MGTSASFARKALSCLAAALLAFTLVPAGAFAGENDDVVDFSEGEAQEAGSARTDESAGASAEADGSIPAVSAAEAGTLAASLIGRPISFVNADVALDGEPIIGSFTVDGLTFAVTEGSNVELVGVSGLKVAGSARAASEVEAEGSASEPAASVVALPESVAYNDAEYAVASIGAYAFYLSGVTSVELPASIANVDDRAFRSSDVASVTVAEGNPVYSSFDGALYSADRSSLLLIPEGKQGAVLLPKETEVAEAGKFSHCSLVDAISAEDGAAFASENGLLYDASLATLLRVPAGATEIAIREGCVSIAAGAMEACVKLERINAPSSVTSISPDVFCCLSTASVPVVSSVGEGTEEEREEADRIAAIVALGSSDAQLPSADPSSINVSLLEEGSLEVWKERGFSVDDTEAEQIEGEDASLSDYSTALNDQGESAQGDAESMTPAAEYPGERIYSDVVLPAVRYGDSSEDDLVVATPVTTLSTAATMSAGAGNVKVVCKTDPYTWVFSKNGNTNTKRYNANVTHQMDGSTTCYWTEIQAYSSSNSTLGVAGHSRESFSETVSYLSDSTWRWFICTSSSTAIARDTGATITWSNGTTEPMYRGSGVKGYAVQPGMTITLHRGIDVLVNLYGKDGNNTSLIGTTSAVSESALPSVTVPTRAGYTFDGYYTSANGAGTKYYNANGTPALTMLTATTTRNLYAKWNANPITLTWNSQGGSAVANTTQTYSSSAKVALPANPTKTGYAFKGWFTAASGGTQITANTALPTANTTYHAQWTANSYTVEYWNKAGTTKLSSDTGFKYDTARNLAAKPSSGVNAGYTAVGWATSANQTKAAYGFSSSQKNLATSGTKKLYLAETANTIMLTWNSQGGNTVANTTQTYSSSAKVALPANPTRTGYAFKGWFTAASGGTQITANTALPTANTTYHAQWTANSYTVEYWNKAGTTKLSTDTGFKYDTARNLAAKPSSGVNAGYTAVGWATSANQSTAAYGFGSSQKNLATSGTKKLYLAETANTIRTTWNYNGGMIDGNTGSTYRDTVYASGKKLADALESDFWSEGRLSRAGYYFAGWFTSASGGTQVTSSTALPTANATYYAHWVAKGPKVQFHAGTSIWRTIDRSSGGAEGAGSFPSPYSGLTYTASLVLASGRVDAAGVPSTGDPKEVVYHVGLDQSIGGVTSAWLVKTDSSGKKTGQTLGSSATSLAGLSAADVYLNGYGASTVTWDAGEGECDTERTEDVMPYDTVTAPAASRKGYIMAGWYDGTAEDAKLACKPGSQSPQVTGDVTYYARWVPAVSAVAPIQATVRLDILGTEDQAMDEDAPGYIESRCGEPLDVASVAFEAKAGASELFGAYVPDIELQALPGKDASWETGSPAFSFALDAAGDAAIEDDASKLAGLSMSGYEVRIPMAYRFAIPDSLLEEVLASIDPARFEQVTTPVCSVVYTVALA